MANWHLDQSYHLDWQESATIDMEMDLEIEHRFVYAPFGDREILMELEITVDSQHGVALDLLELVPEKFRKSEILVDFLYHAGLQVGSWLTSVEDIIKLLNPRTAGTSEYLRHLGALLDVDFSPEDESTLSSLRKELTHAIDWYKMKGTYQSIHTIAMIQSFTVNIYDMYTNDYNTFYLVDWFVGDENENPSGLDSSYYKSPHFGIEILLNKTYEVDSYTYLWRTDYLENLFNHVEKTRPVHTVPHYILLLNPKTDEFGHIIEVDGEIKAKVLGEWQPSIKYFDAVSSGEQWDFDDGTYFDQSAEGFIKSITKWVLGTGNYPCGLGESGADVEAPALTGTIDTDDITITDEKITFEFIVPKLSQQNGLSELGLYVPGSPDTLVLLCCFPKLDKDDQVELKVKVEVFKKDLS